MYWLYRDNLHSSPHYKMIELIRYDDAISYNICAIAHVNGIQQLMVKFPAW